MKFYRLITILSAFLLVSCAAMDAKGPIFEPYKSIREGTATIYLYKPDSASEDGVTTCLALTLFDVEYGCVKGKGYIAAEASPGTYKAALINKASFGYKLLEFEIDLKAGEVVYLEYAFGRQPKGSSLDRTFANYGVALSGSHVVAKVQENDALPIIKNLSLSQ